MENEGLAIEFTVPTDMGICYLEAALKIGMQSLLTSKGFMQVAENNLAVSHMKDAEESLDVLLKVIEQAKIQILTQSNPQRSNTIPDCESDTGASGMGDTDIDDEDVSPLR